MFQQDLNPHSLSPGCLVRFQLKPEDSGSLLPTCRTLKRAATTMSPGTSTPSSRRAAATSRRSHRTVRKAAANVLHGGTHLGWCCCTIVWYCTATIAFLKGQYPVSVIDQSCICVVHLIVSDHMPSSHRAKIPIIYSELTVYFFFSPCQPVRWRSWWTSWGPDRTPVSYKIDCTVTFFLFLSTLIYCVVKTPPGSSISQSIN